MELIKILKILQVSLLADLHALNSGLKSVTSFQTAQGIEQCRLSCGGHGYLLASGIPQIFGVAVGGCTYEGKALFFKNITTKDYKFKQDSFLRIL